MWFKADICGNVPVFWYRTGICGVIPVFVVPYRYLRCQTGVNFKVAVYVVFCRYVMPYWCSGAVPVLWCHASFCGAIPILWCLASICGAMPILWCYAGICGDIPIMFSWMVYQRIGGDCGRSWDGNFYPGPTPGEETAVPATRMSRLSSDMWCGTPAERWRRRLLEMK